MPFRKANYHQPKHRAVWFAFTAIVLIAFFFRYYRLADHPMGIFFDPAINGLDALRLMQRGGPVLFFSTNGGREALFVYLLIPFIWLFDTTPFSLRALTVTISLLNVVFLFAFLYRLPSFWPQCRKLFREMGHGDKGALWLAGLASLILAVSGWHIAVSRLGQRPILVPMLSVPLIWFFLKGWATGQRRWFILAGLLMGLEGYTYSAARLLPVILVLAIVPEFSHFFNRTSAERAALIRLRGVGLLVFGMVALIVYLPMAIYLITHPAQFMGRASSVMVWNFLDAPAEIAAELGRNGLRVAGFFCCSGSSNPIFGLPGYPGLSPLLTPFLLMGLISALRHWRDLFQRWVAIWWLIGIAPSIVAIEAPHPLRMIVAIVPTAILAALGFISLFEWFQRRFRVDWSQFVLRLSWLRIDVNPLWFAVAVILASTPGLFRAYFFDWTDLEVTRGVYDYGAIAIRDQILEQAQTGRPIYLPLGRFNDSTLLYYLSGSFQREAALSATPASSAAVIAPEPNEADTTWVRLQDQVATVLPPLNSEGQHLIQTALAGEAARSIRATAGEAVARLAVLPTDPAAFVQQPTHPLAASFGPVRLTGAGYDWIIDPSWPELPVTLFFEANGPMKDEYEILLRLVDDDRRVWGNGDARPTDWVYPTTFWRPGQDHVGAEFRVVLEPGTLPPGRYWLELSVFDPATSQRLPLTAGTSPAPDTFFIGPLKVPVSVEPAPLAGQEFSQSSASFGDLARLDRVLVDQSTVAAGESIQLTLLWEPLKRVEADYTVFIHLLDTEGQLVAGHDSEPVEGQYPTTIWSPGEVIFDPHHLPTPDALAPGSYRLAIGLYHQPTEQRLPIARAKNGTVSEKRLILSLPITIIELK